MKKRAVRKKSKNFNISNFKINFAIFLALLILILFILISFFKMEYNYSGYNGEVYKGSLYSELPSLSFIITILSQSSKSLIDAIIKIPTLAKWIIIGVLILFMIVVVVMIKRSEKEKIIDKWIDGKILFKDFKKNGYSKETISKIFQRKGWTNKDIERIIKD